MKRLPHPFYFFFPFRCLLPLFPPLFIRLLFYFFFSSFLVSTRSLCHSVMSGPHVWDYPIPLLHDQLYTFEIHLPMSALPQDIELPFSGV
jgi:hypothetical protein